MVDESYEHRLFRRCDPDKITELSNIVFVEGHLEKLDDLILEILPLANIVYYKSIRALDDREYAKEDLISEAILSLYQDMSLRWDKYIYIDSYYSYYSIVLKNCMIELVHRYHNYYNVEALDIEVTKFDSLGTSAYDTIEYDLLKDSIEKNIVETSIRLLRCRTVNTNLLINIFKCLYVDKSGIESLRSRVRVLGINKSLFNAYCEHVIYIYRLAYNYQYAILGGKQKMIDRISNTIDRFEDTTYKMLATEYYDSIVPEIYAEFGADIAKKFIKTFSGRTIQVPEYKNFCDTLLGGIVLNLADGDRNNLHRLSEEYNIPYKILARIYNKAMKYENGEGDSE